MELVEKTLRFAKKTHRKIQGLFLGEEFDDSLYGNEHVETDLSVYRYPSFSPLLNYRYYDSSSQIFFNQTSAGFLYRLTPLTGANENLAEQLDSLLRNKVTDKHTLHLIRVTHNKVGEVLDRCAEQFKGDGLSNFEMIGDHLLQYWKNAAESEFVTNTDVVAKLMHTECYLVVDQSIDEIDEIDEMAVKAELSLFKRGLESSLVAAQIGHSLCDVNAMMRLVSFYIQPDASNLYNKQFKYDEDRALNEQFTNADFECEVRKNGLSLFGVNAEREPIETVVSMLTMTEPPDQHAIWNNIDLSNNIFEKQASVNCNNILSVTYKVENQATAQFKASRKAKSLAKKANSVYARNVAGTKELAKQYEEFNKDLSLKKTKSVKILYNLMLFSNKSEQGRDIQLAKTAFAYSGVQLSLCTRQHLTYYLASMPFMFSGFLEKDFSLPMMMCPISSWNAVQTMPILSDWSGNKNGILLPTMRNQTALIDPFSGVFGTGFNIVVSGMTRAGKSFLMQMMMLNVLFNGGDIFIIDVGGSYKKMAKVLGAVYLEYENLAMNPFTHIKDIADEIDDIINLFCLLALPKTEAKEDDIGTIRQAILNAFNQTGNDTIIDDVQASLEQLYKENPKRYSTGELLAKNLAPYCMDAEHGKAFNLPSKLSPDARMIVVDLKKISKKENIKLPVLLSVFSQYQRRMFDSDRSKQKMCIIDEAWSFLKGNPIAIDFIQTGFRTGSRHMCSFVTITQGIADYSRLPDAREVWENAALKLIFKQESSSLGIHNKENDLLTDTEFQILRNFPVPQEAGYSEVLLKADSFSSFHRLFVDPFTLVLCSSKGQDHQKVQDYVNQGMSYIQAVDRVAREHYGEMYA